MSWIQLDAKSPEAFNWIERAFARYYRYRHLNFYRHFPEWPLHLPRKATVHVNPGADIGFLEVRQTAKSSLINGFYCDIGDERSLDALQEYLLSLKRDRKLTFELWVGKQHAALLRKKKFIGEDTFSAKNSVASSEHYILNLRKFHGPSSLSPRLRRTYSKTSVWIDSVNIKSTSGMNLEKYASAVTEELFLKHVVAANVHQMTAQFQSKSRKLNYWMASVRGEFKDVPLTCDTIFATFDFEKCREAIFLYQLDNRKDLPKAWLSPGTVCQIAIMDFLRKKRFFAYNLGMMGPTAISLSEYKSQYPFGRRVEYLFFRFSWSSNSTESKPRSEARP